MSMQTIARYSFPSNHLITAQLMKVPENEGTLKAVHFAMMALMPGTKNDSNNRSYDFKNGIHVKFSLHELAGLAWALQQYAVGNTENINYVKFAQSNGTNKTVSLAVGVETTGKNNTPNRLIQLRFSSGSMNAIKMSCDQAAAMSEILMKLYHIGCDLELTREVNADVYKKQYNTESKTQTNDFDSEGTNPFDGF